jgi:drug/metabolite transporter (DMT)-like permease
MDDSLRDWQKDLLQERKVADTIEKVDTKEIMYGIITFFASFAILYFMQPTFILQKQDTKSYESARIDYSIVFLISGFFGIGVMSILWMKDRSEILH